MAYRRPPSDVERMTSLRVDNLPYSACMEVTLVIIVVVIQTILMLFLILFRLIMMNKSILRS